MTPGIRGSRIAATAVFAILLPAVLACRSAPPDSHAALPLPGAERPPLVVVPGGPGFPDTYLRTPLEGVLTGERLVFFDLAAAADPRGRPVAPTLDRLADELEALRRSLGAPCVELLGHSFGGLVVLRYARAHPRRVARLVIVEGDPTRREDWERFREVTAERRSAEELLEAKRIAAAPGWSERAATAERYFRLLLRAYFFDPHDAERLELGFDRESAARIERSQEAMRRTLGDWDFPAAASDCSVPTLLVYGEASVFPAEAIERTHRSIACSRLVSVPRAGHFPFLENPEKFGALVRPFLSAAAGEDRAARCPAPAAPGAGD